MTRPFFQNEAFRTDTLKRIKLGRLGQLEDLDRRGRVPGERRRRADDRHVAGGRRRLDGGSKSYFSFGRSAK